MYEGERDHCHSISAIFNLISSQNFICQLNHCRQTLQRWEVGEKKSRKQTKEGPFAALRIFYLFLSSVYFNISYMPKLRLKKMINGCSLIIKYWLQRNWFCKVLSVKLCCSLQNYSASQCFLFLFVLSRQTFVVVSAEGSSRFCHLYAASYGQNWRKFYTKKEEAPSGSYKSLMGGGFWDYFWMVLPLIQCRGRKWW